MLSLKGNRIGRIERDVSLPRLQPGHGVASDRIESFWAEKTVR